MVSKLRIMALIALTILPGCAPVDSRVALLSYYLLSETSEIDPATGDTVWTSLWKLSDGRTVATFKRIPRGNTDRRGERPPPPSPRVID